jgi:fumigallin biosynthesis monooxygenase-like protein
MARIVDRRVTAEIEGDFVVFLIGMRINRLWKVGKWLPVLVAMPLMIKELERRPQAGLLGASFYIGSPRAPLVVQYWRSFEHLERYARSRDARHWPVWVRFNKRIGSSGDVGIWHESFLVPAGSYDSVYNNMPPTGLGAVSRLVPAAGRKASAAGRAGLREEPYPEEARTGSIEI